MAEKKKKITSVEEYRRQRGEHKEVELPSGAVFEVKVLSVMDYIKLGLTDIPNDFFRFISEIQSGLLKDTDSVEAQKNYEFFQEFLKLTIENGVINPPMCLQYDKEKIDTHLIYSELSHEDQVALADAIVGKS